MVKYNCDLSKVSVIEMDAWIILSDIVMMVDLYTFSLYNSYIMWLNCSPLLLCQLNIDVYIKNWLQSDSNNLAWSWCANKCFL